MLLVICNHCHAGLHTVSTTDQPVQHSADRLSDVLVCSLYFVPLGVGVARQESPILNGARVKAWLGLREAMKIKVLDERLKDVLVIPNFSKRLGRVPCWREGWETYNSRLAQYHLSLLVDLTRKYRVSYICWTKQTGCRREGLIGVQVGCNILPECIFPNSCPENLLDNERT